MGLQKLGLSENMVPLNPMVSHDYPKKTFGLRVTILKYSHNMIIHTSISYRLILVSTCPCDGQYFDAIVDIC
jgi:hypothetical protein